MADKRLGKGLGSLIGGSASEDSISPTTAVSETAKQISPNEIDIGIIKPNRYQPRSDFDFEGLKELGESLKRDGFIQPIVVRRDGEGYEIVAGERRWRAAKSIGLTKIPVVVMDVDDKKLLTLALIENLQRKDLNPIEKARGFKALVEKFNLTQEEVAETVGVSRPTVTNFIRLLELSPDIQALVSKGVIPSAHAKLLLSLPNETERFQLANRIVKEGLTVEETEKVVAGYERRGKPKLVEGNALSFEGEDLRTFSSTPPVTLTPQEVSAVMDLEQKLIDKFATKVTISHSKDGRGVITIHYFSDAQLNGILKTLGI